MSFDSLTVNNDSNKNNSDSISTYHQHHVHIQSSVYDTSSMVMNVRQLRTDIQSKYQHEKYALTELNDRFRLFVDRVQWLESENSKYLTQLADFQRQWSGMNDNSGSHWSASFLHLQSDLTTVSNAKVDYDFDFELFQLQIGIYQKLINIEQQWNVERRGNLERELKQSASDLISLRTSYAESGREIERLHAEHESSRQQYLALTQSCCNVKKQRKIWDLSVHTLKSHTAFYRNLRSYSLR